VVVAVAEQVQAAVAPHLDRSMQRQVLLVAEAM
jgi:hypothetical protein